MDAEKMRHHAADRRAEHEAEPERRADDSHRLRALLLGRNVRDVGLRGADVATRGAVDDAGDEQHEQGARQAHQNEADGRSENADEEHGLAADAIGQLAPERRGQELREGERRDEQSVFHRGRMEGLGIDGQHRDDDAEPDHIDQDGQENNAELGGTGGHGATSGSRRSPCRSRAPARRCPSLSPGSPGRR